MTIGIVSIAHSIESNFKGHLDTSSSMFGVATGSHSNEYAQGIRRDLVRQLLFLDAWIAILVELPSASLPLGEPTRSLQRLFDLTIGLSRLDRIQGGFYFQPRLRSAGDFANPWGRKKRSLVVGEDSSIWQDALKVIGTDAGAEPGCAVFQLLKDSKVEIPAQLLLGFAIGKLALEGQTCGALSYERMADDYASGTANSPTWKMLEPLRRFLGDETHAKAHKELVTALGTKCPMKYDPWGVCDWIGDQFNKKYMNAQARLPLHKSDRFISEVLFETNNKSISAQHQVETLIKRVRLLRPKAELQVSARISEPSQVSDVLNINSLWTHPRHSQVAVLISVTSTPPLYGIQGVARTGQVLLVFGKSQASLVSLPLGWSQYDDGWLAALSDIDGDMRLEAWFGGVWGECDGENEIAGETCAFEQFQFGGEIFGSELMPFIRGFAPTKMKRVFRSPG